MFTLPPVDVDNIVTIGEIVGPTASPTPSPTSGTQQPLPTVFPVPIIPRRYIQNALSIYGYGPVESDVFLVGFGVSERTTADSNGLFIFSPIYSYSYIYPELCIHGKDDENRVTSISCIPGLSKENRIPLVVGPVYLSPTVSISGNWKVLGDHAYLEGKTAPNTEVNIYITKSFFLPNIKTKSDSTGHFSITLPTSSVARYKMFVTSRFGDSLSAKSNSLTFVVMSKEQTFINVIISWLLKNKLLSLIISEVMLLIFLTIKLLKSTTKVKKRHAK